MTTFVIKDKNLKPENIKAGVKILKVTGSYEGGATPVLQAKSIDVSSNEQVVTPDASYDGLSSVTVSAAPLQNRTVDASTNPLDITRTLSDYYGLRHVYINPVDASIDANIEPGNIKSGVTILGVEGDYEGEWDWVVQAKRHEIDDVTDKSLEELAQLEWGACGILSGTEIAELPEIDFGEPIATHGLAYSLAGTGISDVEIPAETNALNAHSCFEGMFFDCNDLEHVSFTDFDVTPYTDGEMSEHFERAFMNAGGNVSPAIEWDDPEDHSQGGVMSPGLLIEFPNLTYANSNMFNEAFRGIKGADASFGILGVEFPSLEKIGGAYMPSNNAKALPSNNGVKCFYNAFHSSRLYNGSEGGPIDESDMQYGTMQNIFPALTEIHGNGVFAHAFSRSNLYNFGFPNELTLYLAGESETEGIFECVCRDCKDLQSISLSAKYDLATVDRNTKVWRDAFDGCDDLTAAYISDTLVAYPDERNILESAPNIQYIELNTLPDFDYTINTYTSHEMYFTWQPGLTLQSIWNILDFTLNEFQDVENNPYEIWFYENTILEDNAEYDPDDPNSVQLVDDIMNMKAELESYGWMIYNLYKSEQDIHQMWEYRNYLKLYHDPNSQGEQGGWLDTGVAPMETMTFLSIGFSAPDTTDYMLFGCDNGGTWGEDERIFGVYIDNDDMYIGFGHSLSDCLVINKSDIDFTAYIQMDAELVETDPDVYEWNITINNDNSYTLDQGDLSDMNNITLFSRYNSADDEYDMFAPGDTTFVYANISDQETGEEIYFDPARFMKFESDYPYDKMLDEGEPRLAVDHVSGETGISELSFKAFNPLDIDNIECSNFQIALDETYTLEGADRQMLPDVFEGGVPAFVEGSGGGSDFVLDVKLGTKTAITASDIIPSPTVDNAYKGLFKGCTTLQSVENTSITDISVGSGCNEMFRDCSYITSVELSGLTSITGDLGAEYMFGYCSNLASADLSDLTTINATAGARHMFSGCSSLETVDLSSLSYINKEAACWDMFNGCSSLETVDLSSLTTVEGWVTGQMKWMFMNCTSLTFADLSGLSSVTCRYDGLRAMFSGCTSLEEVDLSSLRTISGNRTFEDMFSGCTSLTTIDIHPDALAGTSTDNNPIPSATYLTAINLSATATNNIHLDWQPSLSALTVLALLHGLDLTVSGKSVTFYTGGLTVSEDDAPGLQQAYDDAVDAGWTINNLTINPPSA